MKKIPGIIMFVAAIGIANASRMAPKEVPAVTTSDVIVSAPHFVQIDGKNVHGGVIEAKDPKSGKLLWRVRVYETKYDPVLAEEEQDVFIDSISLVDPYGLIVVRDERGRLYVVNLKTQKATDVK